jgi:predicted hotdog family 3-hydroxylacyl-ACP dehydratase
MMEDWPLPSLLPHSGLMILIGEPMSFGEGWAEATVRIGEDSRFYKQGRGLPAWVGVEYMAQTIALYAGFCAKMAGEEIKLGLLLGSRKYTAMTAYFQLGAKLLIRVEETYLENKMGVFDCFIEDRVRLAEAQFTVYQSADFTTLIAGGRS